MHKYRQPLPDQHEENTEYSDMKSADKPCSASCYMLVKLSETSKTEIDTKPCIGNLEDKIINKNKQAHSSSQTNLDCKTPDKSDQRTFRNKRAYDLNDSGDATSSKRLCTPGKPTNHSPEEKTPKSKPKYLKSSEEASHILTSNEETLYKVFNKIYEYNSCALAKIIRSKTCAKIRDYMWKYDTEYINHIQKLENSVESSMAAQNSAFSLNKFDQDLNLKKQNLISRRKKKKNKTKQTHFLARKLHEEAANTNTLNAIKKKGRKPHENGDVENGEYDPNAIQINSYHPCDHPGNKFHHLLLNQRNRLLII